MPASNQIAPSSNDGSRQEVLLDPAELDEIRRILDSCGVTAANEPMLFGSRVTGTARRYSDLDIGLAGEPLPFNQLGALQEVFEESDLPIRVEVLNLADASGQLREHALQYAVALELAVGRR